ncbi:Putative S-adenosyl-L-methionine-dependent methyltransferase [Chitinophaga sp. YR573]|uniref:SAM-dependent methyltransferase n=1 Tax=Chitinophaga sp. YR573 TaxID=1881040 RepID=UPI0008C47BAA|nr:SAM-dependent methyltransferase [Chitinophaga sp. YR573]SEV89487.1 Putative S-adenosyl-L-methionine-dependent methyltransferase [Chitinophaga sp. YR573]
MIASSEQIESVIIEEKCRFSQSRIWNLQRLFFNQQGTKAWSKGIVPHYVTSNPYIAACYAKLTYAYISDLIAQHSESTPTFDLQHPIYIVELGTGSGRFSFHFMKCFFDILDQSALRKIKVIYVMSDFVQSTINDWLVHPQLQDWVKKGRLDFATFDAIESQSFELVISGESISNTTLRNPLIVIANYFFDTLPVDVFSIWQGKLSEALVSISIPKEKANIDEAELIHHIALSYNYEEVDDVYYKTSAFNEILKQYKDALPDTCINFPIGALHCLQTLNNIANGALMVLTADKGVHQQSDLLFQNEPYLALHGGCFSLTLNYHAIGEYFKNNKGIFLSTTHAHASIDICLLLSGKNSADFIETKIAYELCVEQGSPDDFYLLTSAIAGKDTSFSLPQMIALLRLSRWDSAIFINNFMPVIENAGDLSDTLRQELYFALYKIWDNYFYIGEETDVCLYIGIVLCKMHYYPDALKFFEYSLSLKGANTAALYNIALYYYDLRQLDKCLDTIEQALHLQQDFSPAIALKMRVVAGMQRLKEL